MKIAIIGSTRYEGLEFHLNDELLIQGHESKIFDFHKPFPGKIDLGLSLYSVHYNKYKNKKILEKVLNFDADLVIGVYRNIAPFVVKTLKNNNIKIIHINPDALTTFQNQQLFVEPYDAYFTKDPYIVSFMKDKLELNTFQYNEAFNPRIHSLDTTDYAKLEKDTNIDVLCFGTLYPYRNRMLSILSENGVNLTLFGRKARFFDPILTENFQNTGIYGEHKKQVLNGSKIIFNNLHYADVESVNNKFFEINGSGAFQICDYKPILNDLLPIDPKRVSFNTIVEAQKLINYYLKRDKERWEIRDTIQSHFLENYTYKHLIKHIFSKI